MALAGAGGCSLTETAVLPRVDTLIVEAVVQWRADFETGRALVFLHRSVDGPQGRAEPVDGASVTLLLPDGFEFVLPQSPETLTCVATRPVQATGSCYATTDGVLDALRPGQTVGLRIVTSAGEVLESQTTLPQAHRMRVPRNAEQCVLPPETPLGVVWTRAEGAWAYLTETLIFGLGTAYADRGIEVEEDPFPLLGVSVSAADTTVVFPGELGVFDRADLDQDLALALQNGLPAGVDAQVTVAAADRNLVNWIRGGNFNPSGQVRVPSVRGDGTGFFGSAILRTFTVRVPLEGQVIDASDCLPAAAVRGSRPLSG